MNKINLDEMFKISTEYNAKDKSLKESSISTGELVIEGALAKNNQNDGFFVENIENKAEETSKEGFIGKVFRTKKGDNSAEKKNSTGESDKSKGFQQNYPQEDLKSVEKPCERTTLPSADDYKTSVLEEETKVSSYYLESEDGEIIDITKNFFLIGCGSDCDYVIKTDPVKHTLSRKHAYIIIKNDTMFLKDISSNGTFIGTSKDKEFYRLPKETQVEVIEGQLIKFSDKLFSFHRR